MAASKSTLETTELLELILVNLPLRSVLLVQTVSHLWHATIKTSIKLQQALFLRPIKESSSPTPRSALNEVSLANTCNDILATPARRSIVNDILGMGGSVVGVSHMPTSSLEKGKAKAMESILLTQPPTSSDFLVGNFITLSATEALDLSKDSFVPSEPSISLEGGGSVVYGSFSRLGAIRLENKGLTIGMAAEGIAQLAKRFERAEYKGRELRFFWGSQVEADLMVELLVDIAGCVEDVRRMQRGGARR